MTLESGSFVQVSGKSDGTYQVVSLDDASESCWVRRWPWPAMVHLRSAFP